MYGNRQQMLEVYCTAWHKNKTNQQLTSLEKQVVSLIAEHPEYHDLFELPVPELEKKLSDWPLEENPFMHLSLHMSLREQIQINQPAGIRDCYKKLTDKTKSHHETEHQMFPALVETIFEQQHLEPTPDNVKKLNKIYLDKLNSL